MTPEVTGSFGPDTYVQNNNEQQQAYCDQYNREAASRYRVGMANYNLFIDQVGKLPPYPPPTVPTAWVLTKPDAQGLQWQTTSDKPVCDAIPVHNMPGDPARNPNVIHVGNRISGDWFQVGAGDGFPAGSTTPPTTSADGVSGTFQKYAAPVGAGWYLRVS